MYERASWYVIAGRIAFFFLLTALTYALLFFNLCGVIVLCDAITGKDLQGLVLDLTGKYPIESIIITVLGYVVWTVVVLIKLSITFTSEITRNMSANADGAQRPDAPGAEPDA